VSPNKTHALARGTGKGRRSGGLTEPLLAEGGSEERRIMQDRMEQNALELLQAIREHHPDIYAGAWVNPYTAALEAGLDPESTHYRVAMEYLQAEDVLKEAEESRKLGGGGSLYTITLRGMEKWKAA
jgi:hypothetical protein